MNYVGCIIMCVSLDRYLRLVNAKGCINIMCVSLGGYLRLENYGGCIIMGVSLDR